MNRTYMTLLVAVICTSGCFGGVGGQRYTSSVAKADPGVTDEDLYAASIRIFDDAGFQIRDKDRDAGIVTTKFVQAGMAGGLSTDTIYHAWRVRIEEGTLRIEIDCMRAASLSSMNTGPYTCAGDERKEEWIQQEPQLRGKILEDARRRAQKRANRGAGEP